MKETEPIIFTIFGATGDLAQRKLLPALMDLFDRDFLPYDFRIIGFSRKDLSDGDYKEFVKSAIDKKNHNHSHEKVSAFLEKIHYKQGDLNQTADYKSLNEFLSELDGSRGTCYNKLYYLAVPPHLYNSVFQNLAGSGLMKNCREAEGEWCRVLVEKPFGSNAEEAKVLDKTLGKLFKEDQIFRIDHYLAKETIQNILTFRFANAIFKPIWNSDYIDHINIILHEKDNVSSRASFYDGIGALRDVGQNHMLQMLALVLMDDPGNMLAESVRKARSDALSGIILPKGNILKHAFRAQYNNYSSTEGVDPKSKTETFFKVALTSKDRRWKGVPFYLESGKSLSKDKIETQIVFKEKKSSVCVNSENCSYNNVLTISIKPEEKISICFYSKKPGLTLDLDRRQLEFNYGSENVLLPDAYEKVLYDCIRGDQTLFTSTEEVATEWRIITDIMKRWKDLPLHKYNTGSPAVEITKKFNQ